MNEPAESDPMPGIRAVLLAGFLSGNTFGMMYLLLAGYLLEFLSMAPFLLLAGAFLGNGLVGMMLGSLFGLSLKLVLGDQGGAKRRVAPVILAGTASATMGLFVGHFIVLFMSS